MESKWEKGAAAFAAAQDRKCFLTKITILHVRHLQDIEIRLSKTEKKTLILTGENGSGKSSVLRALYEFLRVSTVSSSIYPGFDLFPEYEYPGDDMLVEAEWNEYDDEGQNKWEMFPPIFLNDDRKLGDFGNGHSAYNLNRLLCDMKRDRKRYSDEQEAENVREIDAFFRRFQNILRILYNDKALKLEYNSRTEHITIQTKGRNKFDFETMARGYSAILEVINVLVALMGFSNWDFDIQGTVLIDEIEVHLHVELQKKILPILTELFPNLQFIVTTHSPFVLASAKNAVVYDLEHRVLAADGLSNVPYSGIVEGYFKVGEMSDKLEHELHEYRALAAKKEWTDRDYADAARLEMDLDSVPDFLAGAWKAEYSRLKLEIAADKGE